MTTAGELGVGQGARPPAESNVGLLGFQSANAPRGLFFQAQTCSL